MSADDFPLRMNRMPHQSNRSIHRHDFSELVIVINGRSTHLTDEGSYSIAAGDVFLVPRGAAHGYRTAPGDGLSLINIMFRFEELRIPFFDLRKSPGFRMLFELEPEFNTLSGRQSSRQRHLNLGDRMLKSVLEMTERLEHALKDDGAGHQFRALGIFIELISALADYFSSAPQENPEHSDLLRLCQVLNFMEKRYTETIYIPDLAKMASMSSSNFYRVFTALIGMSADKYLQALRLSHAETLLTGTELPISEVAQQSGFEDSNYFSRLFSRSHGGSSPRDYRKRHRATDNAKE